MKISITGAPVFYGCDIPGVETAPAKLRQMGLVEMLRAAGHEVTDAGDVPVPAAAVSEKNACHPTIKYTAQIGEMCSALSQRVAGALGEGRFPLVIGGDHSDGIGILSGVARVYGPDTAVLWIDSHSDIHSFATSPSGNVHGVPLGAAIGLECGPFGEHFGDTYIKGSNLFIAGLRSYEPEEAATIAREGVNAYSVEDFRRRGVEDIFADIGRKLAAAGVCALHVSFDIDSLDPAIAPGTGIRVPGGFTADEAVRIVRAAFATGLVHSMDISELNPLRDRDDMTARIAMQVAAAIPV
ncbi:MAG: arginase [Rikenellaceae bacterium]|jgi:arginase|nr:arginase [Rikenellaceae bacterium]